MYTAELSRNFMSLSIPKLTKKQKKLIRNISIAIIFILFIFSLFKLVEASGSISRGYETYNHLADGTFYYEDSNSTAARRFQAIAASILRVVFPFITVFGLTVIIIKMSSSVIYLSTPDFFDDVHYAHYQRRQRKYASESRGAMRAFMQSVKENGIGDSVLKGFIIPDFKAMAFYDACEIGEDGRPSMSTFFKNSFPKYVVIIAMIIMINDQTMLTLYFRAAEVGVYFFQKAAQVEYIAHIERFLNSGKGYDPGWKGAKKNVYTSIERALLDMNKEVGTEKSEYKQAVGSKVAAWMDANMNNIDWDNYRVTAVVNIDTIGLPTLPDNTWQEETLSTFGVKSPDGATKYLTVRITLENKNFWKPEAGKVRTSDPSAWSYSDGTLKLDVTKISGAPANIKNVTVYSNAAATPDSATMQPVSGTTITWKINDRKKFSHVYVNLGVDTGQEFKNLNAVYKNPENPQ